MSGRVAVSLALLLNLSLTRPDIERALALARWPHTDAERAAFHDRYLFLPGPLPPLDRTPAVLQIEIITPFRRAELVAEEHERLKDLFGRGGSDDAVEALRGWQGLVAIDVHLQLAGCGENCTPAFPDVDVGVGDVHWPATTVIRSNLRAKTGLAPQRLGNVVEADFNAAAIGNGTKTVRVVVDGRELARVSVDFSALE